MEFSPIGKAVPVFGDHCVVRTTGVGVEEGHERLCLEGMSQRRAAVDLGHALGQFRQPPFAANYATVQI
jgi:hypothetical protein